MSTATRKKLATEADLLQMGAHPSAQEAPTLRVESLETHFFTRHGIARSVDGVSFEIGRGEHVGLIGESGSGKSVTALSAMRLIRPPGRIVGGRITFEGTDLLALDEASMRRLRGRHISMIFQDPLNHLDPVMRVGDWIAESLVLHRGVSHKVALAEAVAVLRALKVATPEDVMRAYPFQLSGGMCQRILIATALVTEPALIIADEATSALDVTVQSSILKRLDELTEARGTALLLTTHNMLVVRQAATRVIVMYAGRIVESCPTDRLFDRPMHPYTVGLLRSVPALKRPGEPLEIMRGEPPLPTEERTGCAFYDRCNIRRPLCRERAPPLVEVESGHQSACFFPEDASLRSIA